MKTDIPSALLGSIYPGVEAAEQYMSNGQIGRLVS